MEQIMLDFIQTHQLINNGDNVIAAVSGGADSVALLHFLVTNKEKLGINVYCAHFEHGLRGQASLDDAKFVKQLCEKYNIQYYVEYGNMAEENINTAIEETARNLRYAFLNNLAEEHNAIIATGHNQNDNVETMLFNAIRGTGPNGLAGIPVKNGRVVRPMLSVSRPQIEKYCIENNLQFVHDSTNDSNIYSRNVLRNEIIPSFEKVHNGAGKALAHLAADMRELNCWLGKEGDILLKSALLAVNKPEWNCYDFENVHVYDLDTLNSAPKPILRNALAKIAGLSVDRAAIERMEQVLLGTIPKTELPQGGAIWTYKGCFFYRNTMGKTIDDKKLLIEIPLQEGLLVLWGAYSLEIEINDFNDEIEKTLQKPLTFYADYDKLLHCSVFRTRNRGDVFTPQGRKITKTLKKYMNEEGIPKFLRNNIPVMANGSQILWLWGKGFAHGLAPGNNTNRIISIKMLLNGEL